MGPACAVAQDTLRRRIAKLLALDLNQLRLIYMDGSGSYGTSGNDDATFEAALLSRELHRPVRVQWMREEEHGWDPKGPPQLLDLRATLGVDDDIAAWETVAIVPANAPNQPDIPLVSAVAAALDDGRGLFAGLLSLNADPPYTVANVRAEIRWQDN
jgi:nicotinate dehydrogenase subunit B